MAHLLSTGNTRYICEGRDPMLSFDYLTQRVIRLTASEEWSHEGQGLSFIFVKQGKGSYVSGMATSEMAPGDLLVVNGLARGRLRLSNRDEIVFHYFSACLEHLIALFAAKEIQLLQHVTECFRIGRLYSAFSPLAQQCHALLDCAPPQRTIEHRSHLLKLVALILSEEFKILATHQHGLGRAGDHLDQVLEELTSAKMLDLSVQQLAQKFSCSRRHLNRRFHEHFGLSAGALKMEMRMLKALALLQDPEAKVINVAEACGFNHLGLFNTCFKRRFGTSPGQWRKNNVQIETEATSLTDRESVCKMRKVGLCPWITRPDGSRPVMGGASDARTLGSATSVPPCTSVRGPGGDAGCSDPPHGTVNGTRRTHLATP